MQFSNKKQLAMLREKYPAGTTMQLINTISTRSFRLYFCKLLCNLQS